MTEATPIRVSPDGESFFAELLRTRPDVALCRAMTQVSRSVEDDFEGRELGVGEHLVLAMLEAVGPVSQQSLSRHLRIDRTAMVGLVDSLEFGGFARRERDPNDRRAYRVTITDRGREELARADAFVPGTVESAFSALTSRERRDLTRLLRKLVLPT